MSKRQLRLYVQNSHSQKLVQQQWRAGLIFNGRSLPKPWFVTDNWGFLDKLSLLQGVPNTKEYDLQHSLKSNNNHFIKQLHCVWPHKDHFNQSSHQNLKKSSQNPESIKKITVPYGIIARLIININITRVFPHSWTPSLEQ